MFELAHPYLRQDEGEKPEKADDPMAAAFSKYMMMSLIFGPGVSAFWIYFAQDKASFAHWRTGWEGHLYFWWPVAVSSFFFRRNKENVTYQVWEYALKWSLAGPFMYNWYALNTALESMKAADQTTEVKNIAGVVGWIFYTLF